jgi:hypothetical protein
MKDDHTFILYEGRPDIYTLKEDQTFILYEARPDNYTLWGKTR